MSSDLTGFLNTLLLRAVPQHRLSRWMRCLARMRRPWLKDRLIRAFVRRYGVDLSIAEHPDPAGYPDFNSFFTRALKAGARPVVAGPGEIAIPVDGAVSQCGPIDGDRLIQAKGIDYRLTPLLGGSEALAAEFMGGAFATLYLSPRDYHRIHMPIDGVLRAMRYVPGQLFSVNDYSTRHVQGLFTRNERLVTVFDTAAGPMAVILVGAIFVSGIETVWAGEVSPARPFGDCVPDAGGRPPAIALARGAEFGRFNMGSTVIMLFARDRIEWAPGIFAGAPIRMGELLATARS